MSEYDNELRGALFKNTQKREGKQDADYRGNVTVNGVEYWVSSWINTSKKDGSKYMSLSLKPKEQQAAPPASAPAKPGTDPEFDDDIPFAHAWLAPFGGILLGLAAAANAAKDVL